jgi:proteasome alpha subunit
VEILVAEIGASMADDQIYRLTYDGSIADVRGYAVMGGPAEQVAEYVGEHYSEGISLAGALRLAVDALGHDGTEIRQLEPDQIEVAVLDRTRTQVRKFKRISNETLAQILSESTPDTSPPEHAEHLEAAETVNGGSYESSRADDAPVAPPEEPNDDRPL